MTKRAPAVLFWLAALLVWTLALGSDAFAKGEDATSDPWGRRVALVVGNGTYDGRIETLKNATNDAASIAAALKKEHFEVELVENADLKGFKEALARLEQAAKNSDVALFYYSGHGFQLGGKNYLVPTDAALTSRDVIDAQTLNLDDIISHLDSPDHQTLILLDACRNNPLPASVRGNDTGDGLAQVTRMVNTYVAFSTQPGNVSVDGTGSNSPFASALVANLDLAGKSISDVMVKVRGSVLEATNNLQQPFEQSTLTDYFYFNPQMQSVFAIQMPGASGPAAPAPTTAGTTSKPQGDEPIPIIVASLPGGSDGLVDQNRSVPDVGNVEAPSIQGVDITDQQTADTPAAQPETKVADVPPDTVQPPTEGPTTVTPPISEPTQPGLPDDLASAVQQQLKDIGCYTGGVDGSWGGGSRAALQSFFDAKKEAAISSEPTPEVYARLARESGTVCEVKVVQAAPQPQPPKQTTTTTSTQKPPKQSSGTASTKPQAPAPSSGGGQKLDAGKIGNMGGVFR